ncbi:MAG: hypothetical protein JO235_03265 [Chroococcidiopsidaceae cyanobacterium CP_BM_RX_35]|nr:hypothetical protein [Chroococcidiopsidaceae cyanobacterium CP_BM_RX_35]
MFIRVKTIKSHHYYYLVEDERVDGWHRQRVVEYWAATSGPSPPWRNSRFLPLRDRG